jgi:hypothetical protein
MTKIQDYQLHKKQIEKTIFVLMEMDQNTFETALLSLSKWKNEAKKRELELEETVRLRELESGIDD